MISFLLKISNKFFTLISYQLFCPIFRQTSNLQNKNNKICITSHSLGKGGAERSAAILSQLLDNLGYEVHIAILNDEIDYPYSGTLFNMGLMKTDKDTFGSRYKRFRKLKKYLIENEIDVIIDHRTKSQYYRELFYHHYVYQDVQKIYVTHSSLGAHYLTQKQQQFTRLLNKNMCNVAVSKYIEKQVLNEAGVVKTTTIYNTFDSARVSLDRKLPAQLVNTDFILCYGRLVDEIKDISFLIQSYAASKLWEQSIKLVILGDGDDKEMLQKLANSLPGGDSILFFPFTKEPFIFITEARCVALTSKYEGFPMVLLEALSLGTPVVSLDIISGPNEIVQHEENGLLIEKREVPLFAEALVRMCMDTEFNAHCKSNARKTVEPFSSEKIAQDWHNLLQNESN